MAEAMDSNVGVENDVNKVINQLENPNNTLDDTLRALVDAGSFAWFSYGMMAMTNLIYYTDKFYWDHIIRDDTEILAFRTWWGVSEFIRVLGNFSIWTIGLLFWGLTFIPVPAMHVIFAKIATIILWVNIARLAGILIVKCLSFLLDSYTDEYKYYPY
jgi:hypothetical protein